MRKKYGVITLSVVMALSACILLISKESYSDVTEITATCPEEINVTVSSDTLSLIKTEKTEITLPKDIEIYTSDGKRYDTEALTILRGNIKNGSYQETEQGMGMMFLFQILIPNDFSEDKYKNRYYRQIVYWWTIDKITGLDDNYNYDLEGNIIQSSTEEKYDENGNYQYANQLTALEKQAIKELPSAQKIEDTMDRIDNIFQTTSSIATLQSGEPRVDLNNLDLTNITYYVTDDYIETSLIKPSTTDNFKTVFNVYEVNVKEPITVVDENGNQQTEFSSNKGFKLRIPISEINNDEINFDFDIIGYTTADLWSFYQNDSNNAVEINCGRFEKEQTFNTLTTTMSLQVGTLNIKVIDAETKEDLSDAEIVIIDSKGNEVYRYRTTEDTITVTLPVGDYTVRQIVTPPNYEAKTIEQRISVTSNDTNEVVLENIQLVTVPDTLKTTTTITIIGTITILLGTAIILYTKRSKGN